MLRVKEGDRFAFDLLLMRHQRTVLNLVRRFAGPVADAEDLAQDVFVRLYQARSTYEPKAKFTTFLYRNTLNLCLNYIRDQKHRKTLSLEGGKDEEAPKLDVRDSGAPNPDAVLDEKERAEMIRGAVSSLPDNQRMAVILSRWEGCSYNEIAETMDLTIMAVKSLLSRAKENLRAKLQVLLKDEEQVGGIG